MARAAYPESAPPWLSRRSATTTKYESAGTASAKCGSRCHGANQTVSRISPEIVAASAISLRPSPCGGSGRTASARTIAPMKGALRRKSPGCAKAPRVTGCAPARFRARGRTRRRGTAAVRTHALRRNRSRRTASSKKGSTAVDELGQTPDEEHGDDEDGDDDGDRRADAADHQERRLGALAAGSFARLALERGVVVSARLRHAADPRTARAGRSPGSRARRSSGPYLLIVTSSTHTPV